MPFQRGYGGGGAGGNYGGNRGYSSSGSGSGVSPWQGQPAPGTKVDPLALMGSIMGAMMGGGGGNVQQLAGLAMANAIGPDRGYNDRDRRERQVMRVIRVCSWSFIYKHNPVLDVNNKIDNRGMNFFIVAVLILLLTLSSSQSCIES